MHPPTGRLNTAMASPLKLSDYPDNKAISVLGHNLSKALHCLALYAFLVKKMGFYGKQVDEAVVECYKSSDGDRWVGKEFSLQETAAVDLLVYLHACAFQRVNVSIDELQYLAKDMVCECQTQPGRLCKDTRERLRLLNLLA